MTDAELRPVAFAIAYRMLGSVSEAEDAVQEAFLRLHRAREEGERIESPRAYLATVVTRLCIDQLRSARVRRERYVGEWLPEPLVGAEDADPARHVEMADSLSMAFLLLLERLSPEQRAAFLLREVFDYPYGDVARIVDTSEANARQLVSRARRQVEEGRPRYEPSQELRDELTRRFLAAIEEGDLAGLEDLLAEDVVLHGDGGGKVPALARPVAGRKRVARTLLAWARAGRRFGGATVRPRGGQRAAGRDHAGPRGPAHQRVRPPDRRRPRAGAELGGQPGQARAPRPAHRLRRADQAPELSAA